LDEFYQKQNEKLLKLKELFFQTFSPSDYRIIAITLLNRDNVNTWHLMDIDYIERFKDKQPVLQFGSIKINAQKYPAYTKLVLHEDKNKRFLITPEKEKELIKKNIDLDNFKILAERTRLSHFGEIWNIKDDKLNSLYREQLISIRIKDEFYNSTDYRSEVFLIQNKLTNEKFLCNYKGQIVMKK
jgi:hypothetical protein